MITRVPKTRQDAAALSSSVSRSPTSSALPPIPPSTATRRNTNIQFCHVLEVLKDEVHDLEGWMGLLDRQGGNANGETTDARKRRKRQNREQRWAPVALDDDGLRFVDVEFGGKSVTG
jgi:hypothetical protein